MSFLQLLHYFPLSFSHSWRDGLLKRRQVERRRHILDRRQPLDQSPPRIHGAIPRPPCFRHPRRILLRWTHQNGCKIPQLFIGIRIRVFDLVEFWIIHTHQYGEVNSILKYILSCADICCYASFEFTSVLLLICTSVYMLGHCIYFSVSFLVVHLCFFFKLIWFSIDY